MTALKQVIARTREMQKWRRGTHQFRDESTNLMPSTPQQHGQDIDALIAVAEQQLKKRKNIK